MGGGRLPKASTHLFTKARGCGGERRKREEEGATTKRTQLPGQQPALDVTFEIIPPRTATTNSGLRLRGCESSESRRSRAYPLPTPTFTNLIPIQRPSRGAQPQVTKLLCQSQGLGKRQVDCEEEH